MDKLSIKQRQIERGDKQKIRLIGTETNKKLETRIEKDRNNL